MHLMTVPGVGPIVSTATVAAIGAGDLFSKGRDFGAWLGLVPKQKSTGGRTILGKISKRGNRYLRVLFVQGAHAVLLRPACWERHGLKPWIEAAAKRLHRVKLVVQDHTPRPHCFLSCTRPDHTRDLRHPVQGVSRDHAHDCGRSQAPRREDHTPRSLY